jgi:RpiR family carbohydrate utilization transcriptional regulator
MSLDALKRPEPEAASPDLLRILRDGPATLSETQRRIADLILGDPEWAVQTAVEALAARAGVSAPTIVRFARAIGCEGVRDMKLKLAGSLARGTPYLHRSVRPSDGTAEVVRNVVGSVTSVIAEWQNNIDPHAVARAAEAIDRARRVDCHGTGATSYFLAQDLHARLFRLGLATSSFSDAHLQLVAAASMSAADVMVAISYVGRMPTLLQTVRLARSQGAHVVALTRSGTPLAALADTLLSVDVPGDPTMRVGTDAYVVQMLMIEILAVQIGLKRGPEALARLHRVHDLLIAEAMDSDDPALLQGPGGR